MGVVKWMAWTIIGGLVFLLSNVGMDNFDGRRAYDHTNQSISGTHTEQGVYLEGDGAHIKGGDTFHAGQSYLIHKHGDEWLPLKYKVSEGPDAGQVKTIIWPQSLWSVIFLHNRFSRFSH